MYIIKAYTLLKQITSVKDIKKLVEFADMIPKVFSRASFYCNL